MSSLKSSYIVEVRRRTGFSKPPRRDFSGYNCVTPNPYILHGKIPDYERRATNP
jgi:hypothetical protein